MVRADLALAQRPLQADRRAPQVGVAADLWHPATEVKKETPAAVKLRVFDCKLTETGKPRTVGS